MGRWEIIEKWKSELELWALITELDKKKRGPVVALTLTGRKREIKALEIKAEDPNKDEGLKTLLDKLKLSFGHDETDRIFEAYSKFESINRGSKSMVEHFQEFERQNDELTSMGIKLPTEVLACKILYCAYLDVKKQQMALSATSKLEFEPVKTALKRIFGSSAVSEIPDAPKIKSEPAFVTTTETQEIENEEIEETVIGVVEDEGLVDVPSSKKEIWEEIIEEDKKLARTH